MNDDIEVIGEIIAVEVIASGASVRLRRQLSRLYGTGQWRKLKGIAMVRFPDGSVLRAEVHWFEAHGRGRHDIKVKRLMG